MSKRYPIGAYADGRFIGYACITCATNLTEIPEFIRFNAIEMLERGVQLLGLEHHPVLGLRPEDLDVAFREIEEN